MLTQLLAPARPRGSLTGRVRRRPERPHASGCPGERLLALDTELARRAGEAGRLRFEMGRGLDLLEQSGGHHALGDFRHWEAIYLRHRGSALRDTTFLRFACELFLDTWRPRGLDVEYAHIYERDRHRCQSPCCGRRDVTPHHLRFRSHGGDDSDENLTSLCTWCHLEGVHRGQISAMPPASNISWTFGRSAHTVVEGRRRTRACDDG